MKDRIQEEARQKFFENSELEQEEKELLESEKELLKDFTIVFFTLLALATAGFIIAYLLD